MEPNGKKGMKEGRERTFFRKKKRTASLLVYKLCHESCRKQEEVPNTIKLCLMDGLSARDTSRVSNIEI